MTLGEKIKAARLEAGMSQRQLCGDVITRNMLSQIENGSANPSMATLRHLATALGKPLGYFMEEDGLASPNPGVMDRARQAYSRRQYAQVLEILEEYRGPDALFDAEWAYLSALAALAQAEALLARDNPLQAVPLLENVNRSSIYYRQDMEQTRKLLLRRAYPMLEEYHRGAGNFEQAYYCACRIRELQRT